MAAGGRRGRSGMVRVCVDEMRGEMGRRVWTSVSQTSSANDKIFKFKKYLQALTDRFQRTSTRRAWSRVTT
jgi:hypothetical protein